jgi:hypothetical protein
LKQKQTRAGLYPFHPGFSLAVARPVSAENLCFTVYRKRIPAVIRREEGETLPKPLGFRVARFSEFFAAQ